LALDLPDGVAGVVYMPYSQSVLTDGRIPAALTLLASVASDSPGIVRDIEQLARHQDPNVPVGPVQRLEHVVSGSIAEIRSTMLVFLSFAGAAVVLAAIGIYGLMSFWVTQRTYEIGLRVAVGCTRQRIVSLILGHGMKITVCGVTAGIATALLLTRYLETLLYGIAASDALTFTLVTALVLGVAIAATALPAWRASRIDPIQALRAE
jgi:ABC-type antimicrobial peptide transport system permease subunit